MKKTLLYSALVLLLASMACNKTDRVNGDGDTFIRFAPATEDTRALVYQSTLNAETFRVYDFMGTTKYIDNQIAYSTDKWVYTSPNEDYLWKSGDHKLFGYTASLGALPDNKVITLSKVLTTSAANQVDYLYSTTVNTTAADWKHDSNNSVGSPVKLEMHHLFAAVSMAVKNDKGAELVLNTCTVPQIANSSTATIDYSGTAVAVDTGTPVADATTPFVSAATAAEVTLSANAQLDILTQALATGSATPYVIWPQTIPDMTIAIKYTMNGSIYETSATIPTIDKETGEPLSWEAGKLYQYTLIIGEANDIVLTFEVKNWVNVDPQNYEFE